jgi:DNA helicase IV
MDQHHKDQFRQTAQEHVDHVVTSIQSEVNTTHQDIHRLEQIIKGAIKGSHDEQGTDVENVLVYQKKKRLQELDRLGDSPFFNKCILQFDHEPQPRTVYFGKFPHAPQSITSWTTPLARLRFHTPGNFEFQGENNHLIKGKLYTKDQYMISGGHITFLATEGVDQPRELIHQERLQRKKTEFTLPEIVQQMEKAQDDVIRAHWHGSFLIAGPAGSGKTTLALHRVAYLAQAPETEGIFPSHQILVLVQDISTKKYFSALLPELGITKVNIETFDEWIMRLLSITDFQLTPQYLEDENQSDSYESAKHLALTHLSKLPSYRNLDWQDILLQSYHNHLTPQQDQIFLSQLADKQLDRFDLTILGHHSIHSTGALHQTVTKYQLLKNMKHRKYLTRKKVNYALIIVDEAENYLAQQISLLRSCLSHRTQAMLYVGDLAQQTKTHTIKDWNLVGESFALDRKVELHKVYRNTKQILHYIRKLGFHTTIPDTLRDGHPVQEIYCETRDHELRQTQDIVSRSDSGIIGILSKNSPYLQPFRDLYQDRHNILVMTINEAQGVEFDTVCLVGYRTDIFDLHHTSPERARVNRDLLYVALTRAMNELYVLGNKFGIYINS